MALIENFRYRSEIDGLRAVAVIAVIFFHAGLGFSGGFVGVDIFFVISGFLITSLIWKDLESQRFSFATFMERRARRIVPALFVVTIAVLLLGLALLLPVDLQNLGRAATWQAVFAANFYYWLDSGYFAAAASQKPLLHTWSLAVEEQFYLVVPFLLLCMYRVPGLRRRAAVLGAFGIGIALSLAASVYSVKHFPTAAFYLLSSRAWELLFGSFVAFLPTSPSVLRRRAVREIVSIAGLGMILFAVLTYNSGTPFPGFGAVPPCLGAALIIWANTRPGNANAAPPTIIGTLLSLRPVVFVGAISYSLYLWHWPILAFTNYIVLTSTPLRWFYRLLLLGTGFGLAVLSWKYVETPFRTRRMGHDQQTMFTYSGSALAAIIICGLIYNSSQGFPQRLSPQAQKFAYAGAVPRSMREMTNTDILDNKLIPIGITDKGLPPSLLVWGDSHADAALPAVDEFLKSKGLAGLAATHSMRSPVLSWYRNSDAEAVEYNDSVFSYIQQHKIHDVLLVSFWKAVESNRKAEGGSATVLNDALLATVKRLVAAGVRPWVMLDVPTYSFDVPKALSSKLYSESYVSDLRSKSNIDADFGGDESKEIAALQSAGAEIIDPKPRFLDPTGKRYSIQSEGVSLYRDGNHVSPEGAKMILAPLLRDSLHLGH